jgi:hypothetical protein
LNTWSESPLPTQPSVPMSCEITKSLTIEWVFSSVRNLPWRGGNLEPGGQLYRRAHHRVMHALLRTDVAGDGFASGDAD